MKAPLKIFLTKYAIQVEAFAGRNFSEFFGGLYSTIKVYGKCLKKFGGSGWIRLIRQG